MSASLTEKDIKTVTELLKKLEPGFLPFSIFHQIARLSVMPIIEVVPLRRNHNKIEILLLQRESDDPVWPKKLHTPGTALRATDTMEKAFKRIFSQELNNVSASAPKFVKNVLHHSGRGLEASQVYWTEILSEPTVGTFYDIDNLPDDLVKSQMDFIPYAIGDYKGQVWRG